MSANKDFTIQEGVLTKGLGGDVIIPENVTSIGDSAFENRRSLISITIPESVTSVGDRAFFGCSSLTRVAIPDSVTSVGVAAFEKCGSLESIAIPEHIANVDSLGLRSCERLADADGHIIVNHVYIGYCGTASQVVIPDGVTSI